MKKKNKPIQEDKPSRASVHPGSTTQGGSNFGQGSSQLGKKALKQGSEKSEGSNYDNEKNWNNDDLQSE